LWNDSDNPADRRARMQAGEDAAGVIGSDADLNRIPNRAWIYMASKQKFPWSADRASGDGTVASVGKSTDPGTAKARSDALGDGPVSFRYNDPGAQYPSSEAALSVELTTARP
jgi:hypothetical protein